MAPVIGVLLGWASAHAQTELAGSAGSPGGQDGHIVVQASPTPLPDWVCPPKPPQAPPPAKPPKTRIPSLEELPLGAGGAQASEALRGTAGIKPLLPRAPKVAIWGDSHMAAAYFSDELQQIAQAAGVDTGSRYIHASAGFSGIRTPLRKICVEGGWRRESAHVRAVAAEEPGPALVNLVNERPGAWLGLDLRDRQARPQHRHVDILYARSSESVLLRMQVDGGPTQWLTLPPGEGVSRLALRAEAPLSTLRLEVVSGTWRYQGLRFERLPPDRLQIDVFAYPGSTVAGWAKAQTAALKQRFDDQPYDLVVLAYGTNEGNDERFQTQNYRSLLDQAVQRLRAVFPQAQCALIAPPDRGVRVPVDTPLGEADSVRPGLLHYTRIHADITRVQQQVAQDHGCWSWSSQVAMGGEGGAYRWVSQSPPGMAGDLIHLTAAGYRALARQFAQDLGWMGRAQPGSRP